MSLTKVARQHMAQLASSAKWATSYAVEQWGGWFLLALFGAILTWEEVWDLPNSAALSAWLLLLITAGAMICSWWVLFFTCTCHDIMLPMHHKEAAESGSMLQSMPCRKAMCVLYDSATWVRPASI